jgi:3-hydroxybutyryl-CoA dehydrogenase
MKVIVVANVEQQKEILLKNTNQDVEMIFAGTSSELGSNDNYDAIFYLNENENIDINKFFDNPVFINSVIETLEENNLPGNFSRINGWPGFLKRPTWEIASFNRNIAGKIFAQLGWNVVFVKDGPGLVSARVISMIINEAFFALGEGISTMEEIDLAMKLGTNYPYGPFEWEEKIGLQNIYRLLHKLSATDKRYSVAPLLEKKYFELSSSL